MTPRRALIFLGVAAAASLASGVSLLAYALAPESEAVALVAPDPVEIVRPVETVTEAPTQQVAPQQVASLRTDVFGSLPGNIGSIAPFPPAMVLRGSRDFAPPPPTTTQPAEQEFTPVEANVPLPPNRPPELAGVLPLQAEAPLPPSRPTDLQLPVQVASLAPQVPDTKPQLVEPQPVEPAAPAPEAAADVPFRKGQPVYVRIFKQEGQLELWLRKGAKFALYKTYPICKWSGHLGPKLKEADYQSPEGFYSVSARQLRPNSNYYRAFDVGFPNALDKQMGYTGGLIMVHGDCKSVGCYAMTNAGIEEIYGFVAAALAAGEREVPVHIFPFRMTETAMARETGGGWLSFAPGAYSQYASFWRNLKEGYDLFEQTGEPPTAYACGGKYAFNNGASCKRIAGW